VMHN